MVIDTNLLAGMGQRVGQAPTLFDLQKQRLEDERIKRQQAMQEQLGQLQLAKAQQDLTAEKPYFEGTSADIQGMNILARDIVAKNPGISRFEAQKMAMDRFRQANPKMQMVTDETGRTYMQAVPQQALFGGGMPDSMRTGTFTGQPMTGQAPPMLPAGESSDAIDYGIQANPDPFAGQGSALPQVDDASFTAAEQPNQFNALMQRIQSTPAEYYRSSPKTGQVIAETAGKTEIDLLAQAARNELDISKEQRIQTIKSGISQAEKELKEGKAQGKILTLLDRMEAANEALNAKKALMSGDSSVIDNLYARLGASSAGRLVQSVSNTDLESLRRDYEGYRNSVFPYYIAANSIPATAIDTEEAANRILNSIGNPAGIYENNQNMINSMREQFGAGGGRQTKQTLTLEEFLSE